MFKPVCPVVALTVAVGGAALAGPAPATTAWHDGHFAVNTAETSASWSPLRTIYLYTEDPGLAHLRPGVRRVKAGRHGEHGWR